MRHYFLLAILPLFVQVIAKAQDKKTILDGALKPLHGTATFEIWHYEGNTLRQKEVIGSVGDGSGELKSAGAVWRYDIVAAERTIDGSIKLNVKFRLEKGVAKEAAVAVSFHFSAWTKENDVMIPAAIYDGNRFPVLKGGYNPPYPPSMYFDKNLPLTFSDNPRLGLTIKEPSKIELLTWNAATPAISYFSPARKEGFIVITEPKTKMGISGLTVEEANDRTTATLSIVAPGVREYAAGFGDFRKSDDKAHDWQENEELNLSLYLCAFPAENRPEFLAYFMDKRKALTGETPQYYVAPMSAIFDYTRQQVDNGRFHNTPYASIYFPEGGMHRFQLGWVGGMMNTYPMLALNDSFHFHRVANTIDFVVNKLQGKSGFFYGVIDDGSVMVPERGLPAILQSKYPHIVSSAMVRKNADALFWFCKHFMLYKALEREDSIKPEWERSARRLAEAFVRTWKENRELGQYIDPESGEILVYNSTAGSVAPAALALAARYFNEPSYLQAAGEIAESYYHRFTEQLGFTAGNCGDICQDADSESAFGLLESFMALYWATGDGKWLEKAKVEAALCSTWTISYNYAFPAGSDLYRIDAHTTGAVWASTQNKHGAPGICTSSGDYLFKLYRATGEQRYAELLRDILNAHTEMVELPGRPTVTAGVGDASRGTKWGMSMERIQISDAEGKSAIGKLYGSNGWTELNGLLMGVELPGIYLQTDKNILIVLDQVEAKRWKDKMGRTMLSIKNPTAYDATVSIFQETSKEAGTPLGYTEFLKWRKVKVKAGETVETEII